MYTLFLGNLPPNLMPPVPSSLSASNSVTCQQNSSQNNNNSENLVTNPTNSHTPNGCQLQINNGAMPNPNHHVPHQDYMGLALKQWSVYLGNVLLNFIHKECKNGSNSVQCSAREQHINNFMNQQISKHSQQNQISTNNQNNNR